MTEEVLRAYHGLILLESSASTIVAEATENSLVVSYPITFK